MKKPNLVVTMQVTIALLVHTAVPAQQKEDCFAFYPFKAGDIVKYLVTTRSVNNAGLGIFEVTHTYLPANDRKIGGKLYRSLLKDEDVQTLNLPGKGLSFYLKAPHRTDRIYLGCGTINNLPKERYVYELREIVQLNSKITGYYTQVTESYNTRISSLIPTQVNYEDLPIVEIEKLGTGSFNERHLYTTLTDPERVLEVNQEIRADRSERNTENPYEYREFYFLGTEDTLSVLGKQYRNAVLFKEDIYRSSKAGVPKDPVLIASEITAFVKGVGPVIRSRYEKNSIPMNQTERVYRGLSAKEWNDGSEIVTVWELVPPGIEPQSSISKAFLLTNSEAETTAFLKDRIDAVFKDPDYKKGAGRK